jgi:hypothetical protein
MYDFKYIRSEEFKNKTAKLQGKWALKSDAFRLGNELLVPVLYPDKDPEYNATMWLTILGFNVESFEAMGDWSSESPKINAIKIGAFVSELDLFEGRPHSVDLKNGTIIEFELA